MDMKMPHGLPCGLSVVLHQIHSAAAQPFLHESPHFFRDLQHLLTILIRKLKHIRIMILGQDQRVPSCSRAQIQNHPISLILIQRV